MFETGFWRIATYKRIPIRLHWSIPLGAVLFGGLHFRPLFWLAFFFLVLMHEFGHAALVRHYGQRVLSVDVTGFGGVCHWSGHASAYQHSVIAWGGVLAQLAILLVTLGLLQFQVPLPYDIQVTFVETNLWLIALNLLPVPPLDGAQAWRLFRHLRGRPSSRGPWARLKDWAARRRRQRIADKSEGSRSADDAGRDSEGSGTNGEHTNLSPESRSELAALFEHISKEAGKAKRK